MIPQKNRFSEANDWDEPEEEVYRVLSKEEMTAVSEFIRSKGRIAIAELASKSATFIDLEGKTVLPLDSDGTDLDDLLNE